MSRAKLSKIKIKSKGDARVFLSHIPRKTLHNLICFTLYKPRSTVQLSKILGVSLREAEKLVKKYTERGFIKAYRYHRWIILGVADPIRTEIISGLSGIINFLKRRREVSVHKLINVIAKDILKFKETVDDFTPTTADEIPNWAKFIFHQVLSRLDELDIEEDIIYE